MTRVYLKGSPAVQWQFPKGQRAGSTCIDLTIDEIEFAKKNNLIESYIDEPPKKIYTGEELLLKTKDEQLELLKELGIDKIPRLEKERVKAILDSQRGE